MTLVTVTGMLRQILGAGKRYDDEGAKPVAAARAGEIGAVIAAAANGRDSGWGQSSLPLFTSPVAEAAAAIGTRMPAGRAVVHRTAATIGPTMETPATAIDNADDVRRRGLIGDWRKWHRLRGG